MGAGRGDREEAVLPCHSSRSVTHQTDNKMAAKLPGPILGKEG